MTLTEAIALVVKDFRRANGDVAENLDDEQVIETIRRDVTLEEVDDLAWDGDIDEDTARAYELVLNASDEALAFA